jgi:hypothetical protein
MAEKMSESVTAKPRRPLGVTLAIFASLVLYSAIPLLQIGSILLVESHFKDLDEPFVLNGQTLQPITGGDFRGGITDAQLIVQGGLALVFLIIAYFAWRGKPKWMRFAFIGAVLALTAITIVVTTIPTLTDGGSNSGGSLDVLKEPLAILQLAVSLLVPVYVIWYLNRAPARAFYRGYYLTRPEPETEPTNQNTGDLLMNEG